MSELELLRPPFFLRNADVQNIISSVGLRKLRLKRNMKYFQEHTSDHLINCGVEDQPIVTSEIKNLNNYKEHTTVTPSGLGFSGNNNVHLSGELTFNSTHQKGFVILLHGWEGSSQSAYILSAAITLFNAGYNVFRLNLRDHGESQNLNRGLFNSTLIDEVLGAIKSVQLQWPHIDNYLAGFSLGGNFALRVALAHKRNKILLKKVIAICPVIDPAKTLTALENASFFYQRYFVGKWRNSLLKKLQYFPAYAYGKDLKKLKSLADMHDFFVPRFTPFANRDEYFKAYQVTHDQLNSLHVDTTIINSMDDPITRTDALPQSHRNDKLSIAITDFGSHCAFIKDFRLNSWVDDAMLTIFRED